MKAALEFPQITIKHSWRSYISSSSPLWVSQNQYDDRPFRLIERQRPSPKKDPWPRHWGSSQQVGKESMRTVWISIDIHSNDFRLHFRATVILLFGCSLLVTCLEWVGNGSKISCVMEGKGETLWRSSFEPKLGNITYESWTQCCHWKRNIRCDL